MAIIATHPPVALVDIVANQDVASLTLVPGVGKKTAERLLVELKSRLSVPVLDGAGGSDAGGTAMADVREALAGLGYGDARDPRHAARAAAERRCRRAVARRAEGAGSPTCVTSSATPASASDVEESVEAGLRPRALDEFVGQRELKEHLSIVLEAARKRGQSVDHLLFAGPPGLGKTTLAGIVATEMGVAPAHHVGSGARTCRRPGGDPHQARGRRRAVHRRDPSAVARRRGDPVSGDGGLPARHRRRQGAGRVEHPLDDAAVHPRRCHHAHRHDHRPAARPVRARRPARLLRGRRAPADRRREPPASSTS